MVSLLHVHWNSLELPYPPQTTITLDSNSDVNINKFSDSLQSLENLLKRVNLDCAGALCSRLIYKNKLKFRTTKWMHLIKKINASMLKLLRMKMSPALGKMSQLTSASDRRLPSRSMFEWFLLKLQGFARLLVRLVVTSHRTGVMFGQCLSIGHNWQIIVTLMALVSQIWTNCQLVLLETFKSYRVVHKTMQDTRGTQRPWCNDHLVEDLGEWISEELATLGLEAEADDIFKIYLPKMKSPVGHEAENEESMSYEEDKDDEICLNNLQNDEEDLGEIISRDDLINTAPPSLSNKSSSPCSKQILETLPLAIVNMKCQQNEIDITEDSSSLSSFVHEKKKNSKRMKQNKKKSRAEMKNTSENVADNLEKVKKKKTKKKMEKMSKLSAPEKVTKRLEILNADAKQKESIENDNQPHKKIRLKSKKMRNKLKSKEDLNETLTLLDTNTKHKKDNNSSEIVHEKHNLMVHHSKKDLVNNIKPKLKKLNSMSPNGTFKPNKPKRQLSPENFQAEDIDEVVPRKKKKKTKNKQVSKSSNRGTNVNVISKKKKTKAKHRKNVFNMFNVEDIL